MDVWVGKVVVVPKNATLVWRLALGENEEKLESYLEELSKRQERVLEIVEKEDEYFLVSGSEQGTGSGG